MPGKREQVTQLLGELTSLFYHDKRTYMRTNKKVDAVIASTFCIFHADLIRRLVEPVKQECLVHNERCAVLAVFKVALKRLLHRLSWQTLFLSPKCTRIPFSLSLCHRISSDPLPGDSECPMSREFVRWHLELMAIHE